MDDLDPTAFPVRRTQVRGVDLAYVREGEGGFPLVLLHGWPETMRIWWRNVRALADAGFEVIVPDLRGFGQSGPAPDHFYDEVASARDIEALIRQDLGHTRVVTCGGDFGGVVAQELALRFEGLVDRQVLFNTIPPVGLRDEYESAGVPSRPRSETRQASDYFRRHANDADGLASELDTPDRRRRYIAEFYGPRFWAAPGNFDDDSIRFMAEPFADELAFRCSIALYESALGKREMSEPSLWFGSGSDVPTLILYGPEDHVIPSSFPDQCAIAFPEHVGPFFVPRAGHFLQWESARVLNQSIKYFCLDLLEGSRRNG
jgi:pimeloyl-ACP methyl ester carboxylesterase